MNSKERSLRNRNKVLSVFVLVCFLFSQFAGDTTRAFAQSEVYDGINLQSRTPDLFLGLPAQTGTVKKVWQPPYAAGPFVVIIQDAHANPEAQHNIKKLLDWFRDKNRSVKQADGKTKVLPIALENLSGTLHPEYFDFFPAVPEANQRAIDDLTAKGELTGPELFAWDLYRKEKKLPSDIQIHGVENAELYKENLRIFRALLFEEEPAKKDLEAIEIQLNKSAGLNLSKDLFDFLKEKQKRKEGQYGPSSTTAAQEGAQLSVYLRFLETSAAEKLKIDLNDKIEQLRFPGLARWKAAEILDKEIARDSNRYRLAWENFLGALVKRANAKEKDFLKVSFSSWAPNPEARAIAESFLQIAQKYSPNFLQENADALKPLERWVLFSELTPDLIMGEMHSLETALIQSLAKTESDKKLMALLEDFSSYRDCLMLKIAERDFESMRSRKLVFTGKSWKDRLEQDGKIKVEADVLPRLDERMGRAVRFYEGAKKRDSLLIEQTVRESENSAFTVLVAGGFHASGMAQELENKNIPYALIQPAITKLDGADLYASVMKGTNSKLPEGMNNDFFTIQQALIFKALVEVALPEALRRFPDKRELIFDGVKKYFEQKTVFHPDLMVWASNFTAAGMDFGVHHGNTTLQTAFSGSSVFRTHVMGNRAEFSDVLPAPVASETFEYDAHYRFHVQPSGEVALTSRAEIRAQNGSNINRSGRPRHRQVVNFKWRDGQGSNAPIRTIPLEIALGGNRSLDFRLASEEYTRGSKKYRRGPTPVTAMQHFLNKSHLTQNIPQGHFFSGQLNHTEYGDGALVSAFNEQLPIFAADLNQRRGNRILTGSKITRIGAGPAAVERKLSEMKASIENSNADLPAYLAFHIDDVLVKKRSHRKTSSGHYEPEYFDKDRKKLMDLLIWFIQQEIPIAFLSNNDSQTIHKYFLNPLSEALIVRDVQRALPIYFYTNGLTNHGLLERTDGWVVTPHVEDYDVNIRLPRGAVEVLRDILGEIVVNEDHRVVLGPAGLLPLYYKTLAAHNGVNFTPSASLIASFPDLTFETTLGGDMTPPEVQVSMGSVASDTGDADMLSIRHLISYASAANGEGTETSQRINLGESEYDPRERLLAAVAAELIEYSEKLPVTSPKTSEALAPGGAEKKVSELYNLDLDLLTGIQIDEHTAVTEQIIFNLRKLFGVEDLIASQLPAGAPLKEEQQKKAVERMMKAIKAMQLDLITNKTARQVLNLETLDRRDFLARFGTQALFRVSTDDVHFSTIIPRSFARGKLIKPDTAYALEGYYKSPGTQPIVILNNRVLGHLLKPEYIKSVDPVTMIFEFTDDIPISHSSVSSDPIVINPNFLDTEQVYHYLGIPPVYETDGSLKMNAVFIFNKTNKGDGEELAAVARLIKQGLPHRKDTKIKYLQRARTDHPTVALDTFSNVSFMTYLELLGSAEEDPAKSSKGITPLQPLKYDGNGNPELRGQSIPFYDVTKELMGLFEWSKIPHGDAVQYNSKQYTPETDYVYYKYSLRGRLETVKNELDALNLSFNMGEIQTGEYQAALQAFYQKYSDFFSPEKELLSFSDLTGKIRGTVSYVEKKLADLRGQFVREEITPDNFHIEIQELRNENAFFTISSDGYLLTRELILENVGNAGRSDLTPQEETFLSLHFRIRPATREFLVATKFNSFELEALSHFDVSAKDPDLSTTFIELLGQMRHQVELVDFGEALPEQVRTIKDHMVFETALLDQDPFQRSLPSMTARTNAVESVVERLKVILVREDAETDFNPQNLQSTFVAVFAKSFESETSMAESFNNFESVIRTLLAESYNQTWQFPLINLLLNMVEFGDAEAGFDELWKGVQDRHTRLSNIRFRIRALLAEAVDTGTLATQAEGGYLANPKHAQITARLKNYFSKIHNAGAEQALGKDHSKKITTDYILERLSDVITEQIFRAPTESVEAHLKLREEVFGPSDLSGYAGEEFSVVIDGKTLIWRVYTLTGGTVNQAAYSKTFGLMGLFDAMLEDFEGFLSYVASTDDGGHSYAIVKSFIDAMYGVLVALGDIGNSLSGFVSPDKRATIMGNDGRFPENSPYKTFAEAIRQNIRRGISDPRIAGMLPDYFMFSHAILDLMRELDKLNEQISSAQKAPLKIPKASLRNLLSAALIFQEGLIRRRSNAETPMIATEDEIKRFESAIQKYVKIVGAHKYRGSVTSFDPKTLFAIYEGYTMRLKDDTGRIESLVITPKYDASGKKIVGVSVKNPQPVTKIDLGNGKAAYSRKRTAVDISLNPGESIRVDDERIQTAFTDTPIEISLDHEGFIKLQIEGKSYTLIENGDKGYTLARNEAYYKKEAGAERPNKIIDAPQDPEASPLNYIYLRSDDNVPDNDIFLSTDGTGRRAEWGGVAPDKNNKDEMSKQAMFELDGGMRVNFIGRIVKSQSFITESAHHTRITHLGLLHHGRGIKGVVPKLGVNVVLNPNPSMFAELRKDGGEKSQRPDFGLAGPGSPLTSLEPILLVKGVAEVLAEKKKRGDKLVLVLNSTYDNESANWSPFEVFGHFQDALKRSSPGFDLEDIFSDMVVLGKDPRIPANFLQIIDKETEKIKKGDPNLSDYLVDKIAFTKFVAETASELSASEKEQFVSLLLALYPRIEPEERFDPSSASHAAKKARGPMGFSQQDFVDEITSRVQDEEKRRAEIDLFMNQRIWRNMKINFLPPSALVVQEEKARVPGETEYRAVFSPEALARAFKTIIEETPAARPEIRTEMPRLDLTSSTQALRSELVTWRQTPQFPDTPALLVPSIAGIYRPYHDLARREFISDSESLAKLVRALLDPSLKDTSVGKNILKTAKTSLGKFGFLLDRLSEQPVHLGGVIGDRILTQDSEDFATLLILLELASNEKFSMTYLVADDDGTPGVDTAPFTNRLKALSEGWGINPEGMANRLRFTPLADTDAKGVVRFMNQDLSKPIYRDSAKGVLHDSLDLLEQFGYQKTLARIHQGDINYETAILVSAALIREKLGEASATASIWDLRTEIQRLGGMEALVSHVAAMIGNIRKVAQAA